VIGIGRVRSITDSLVDATWVYAAASGRRPDPDLAKIALV